MKNQKFWNKRIPTLLALLLIVLGIAATSFLTGKGIIFPSGAAPSAVPKNIRITNISSASFTITYTTDIATLGSVSFGKDTSLGTVILDDRDQTTGATHPYNTHSITVKNLLASTQYYFSITSGETTYFNNNVPFIATTGPPLSNSSPVQQSISGTIPLSADNTVNGILVYVQPQNGQLLSTITTTQGDYHLSLTNLRTTDLSKYTPSIMDTDLITLLLTNGIDSSHVTTTLAGAKTIPPVILSQDYDFTKNVLPNAIPVANIFPGFPSFSTSSNTGNPTILVPRTNESFVDQQPQFSGTAQPNATVTIVIHSDAAIQTQIIADNTGNWTFRPDTPLSSGSHTISITTTDVSGTVQTISQNFTIFPSGTQVFQTATPSATLTPTQMPTTTPTNTPVLTATPTPTTTPTITLATSPTITTTIAPTITSLPTATPMPSITPIATLTNAPILIPSPTRPPLPSTGNASIFTIGIASIITTIVGIGLFLLTKGEGI